MKTVLVAALLLAGCASMGTNFDMAAVNTLQAGMTEAEVVARLGQPNNRVMRPDGQQMLSWVHSQANFLGSAKAKSVSLLFGPDGRLVRPVATTQTSM